MIISSRTPEGEFGRCSICGESVVIDPSHPPGDAPCPSCGSLIWFSPRPGSLERARQRVLGLAREIEDLACPSTQESVFFPGFLQRLLSAVGAPAGVIWIKSGANVVKIFAEQGLELTGYRENAQADKLNEALLTRVIHDGKSQMFGAGETSILPTPTNHLYVVTPLMAGKTCLGIVEVLQRHDVDPRARPGYLQFIEQMGGYASRYLQFRPSRA